MPGNLWKCHPLQSEDGDVIVMDGEEGKEGRVKTRYTSYWECKCSSCIPLPPLLPPSSSFF